MSKAMASVSKNILKYERTVMIMASYNKVVIYETNEWAYINSDTKKKSIERCITNLRDQKSNHH